MCVKEREREKDGGSEGGEDKVQVWVHKPAFAKSLLSPQRDKKKKISKIMQKLTQFAGSRRILRGNGRNTDGHRALKGLRLGGPPLPHSVYMHREPAEGLTCSTMQLLPSSSSGY